MAYDPDLLPINHPLRPENQGQPAAGELPQGTSLRPFDQGFSHHAETAAGLQGQYGREQFAQNAKPPAGQSNFPAYPDDPANRLPSPTNDPNLAAAEVPRSRKSGRLKRLVVFLLLPLMLIGGGGAAAYYRVYLPNQPKQIVQTAFVNLLNEEKISGFSMKFGQPIAKGSSEMATMELLGSIDDQQNSRFDVTYTYSPIQLNGSVLYRHSENELYVKINDLKPLANMFSREISLVYGELLDALEQNWIRVDAKQLQNNYGWMTGADSTCLDVYKDLFGKNRQRFVEQITQAYRENSFTNARKVSTEDIDGRATTKYQLLIDKEKLKGFLLSETVDSSAVEANCPDVKMNDDDIAELKKSIDNANFDETYVWIDNNRQLVKFRTEATPESGKYFLEFQLKSQQLDTTIPTQVMDFNELNSLLPFGLQTESGVPAESSVPATLLNF